MRDLAMRALDTAKQRGADYADVRIVRFKSESVAVRNKNVEALASDESLGFGVRVIVDGYWGFAASHKMTLDEADTVAAEAVRVAKASATVRGPRADIGPPQSVSGTYRTPVAQDPFAVSLDDKIALLLDANETMMRVPNIIAAEGNVYCQREDKIFASTEGAYIEQELYETGCGIEATAVDEGEVQNRSLPEQRRPPPGHRGLGVHRALRPARQRRARRGGGIGAAAREDACSRARRRSSSMAARSRCRSTSRAATRSSWTACSARRRRSPA